MAPGEPWKDVNYLNKCLSKLASLSSNKFIESQNGLGWKGPHLIPKPCHGQGHLPPDQFAQSLVQPGLEHFQEGAATASLGNLCQGLTTLRVKNFFLTANLNLSCYSLKPLLLVLSLLPVEHKNVQNFQFCTICNP